MEIKESVRLAVKSSDCERCVSGGHCTMEVEVNTFKSRVYDMLNMSKDNAINSISVDIRCKHFYNKQNGILSRRG